MINLMVEILATATDAVFMVWFAVRFQGYRLREKPWAWIWWVVFFCYQVFIDHFCQTFELLPVLGVLAITLGCALMVDYKKKVWAVFTAFLYTTVIMLFSSLVFATFSMLGLGENVAFGANTYQRVLYILLSKLIHLAAYRLLLFLFKKDRTLDWKNACLSFSFAIATALGLGFLMKLATENQNPAFDGALVVLAVILIVLNLILYVMIYEIQSLLKKQYGLMLIQERMMFEKSRMDEATVIWHNIRKVKHDLQNHFSVMTSQLDAGDVSACKQYMSKLHDTVENMGSLIRSGHAVIDYLINSKLSNLDNVEVLVSGYVGNYGDICDVDLSCILGNILDNAVEAQSTVVGEKRIELHFLRQNSNRVIICKNTIHESVLEQNRKLHSTKPLPDEHGLGHQIVENTVRKYGGMIDYFESGDMFGVQIMLPEGNSGEAVSTENRI